MPNNTYKASVSQETKMPLTSRIDVELCRILLGFLLGQGFWIVVSMPHFSGGGPNEYHIAGADRFFVTGSAIRKPRAKLSTSLRGRNGGSAQPFGGSRRRC